MIPVPRWLGRHVGALTFGLSLLAVILALAVGWKHGWISAEWLRDHKDALAALSSIVTMVLLVGGAIFSYYGFFRGRMFSLRLDVALEVSVHPAARGNLLHAVTLLARNIGGATVWEPHPKLEMRIHGPPTVSRTLTVDDWWKEEGVRQGAAAVIDPGECVRFFAQHEVSERAWAVTYVGGIRADQGDAWSVSKTVTNSKQAS